METVESFISKSRQQGRDDAAIESELTKRGLTAEKAEALLLAYDEKQFADVSAHESISIKLDVSHEKPLETKNTVEMYRTGAVRHVEATEQPKGSPLQHSTLQLWVQRPAVHYALLTLFTFGSAALAFSQSIVLFRQGGPSWVQFVIYVGVQALLFVLFRLAYVRHINHSALGFANRLETKWRRRTLIVHIIGIVGLILSVGLISLNVYSEHSYLLLSSLPASFLMFLFVILATAKESSPSEASGLHWRYVHTLPTLLIAVLLPFFLFSFTKTLQYELDKSTRSSIISTVIAIRTYTETSMALPSELGKVLNTDSSLGYELLKSPGHYKLCGNFRLDAGSGPRNFDVVPDKYVNAEYFMRTEPGENCWIIKAHKVAQPAKNFMEDIDLPRGSVR